MNEHSFRRIVPPLSGKASETALGAGNTGRIALADRLAQHIRRRGTVLHNPLLSDGRKHVEVCGWSVVARGLLCCPSELAVLFPPIVFDDRAEESDGIRPVSTPRHSLVFAPPGDE